MSVTPEGQEYLGRCRQILGDVADAERAVTAVDDEVSGRLRLTAPVQFGSRHVAPALAAFLDEHPRVDAELELLDRNAGETRSRRPTPN
jgi:DNA-binding transcriptional LysR family regulator